MVVPHRGAPQSRPRWRDPLAPGVDGGGARGLPRGVAPAGRGHGSAPLRIHPWRHTPGPVGAAVAGCACGGALDRVRLVRQRVLLRVPGHGLFAAGGGADAGVHGAADPDPRDGGGAASRARCAPPGGGGTGGESLAAAVERAAARRRARRRRGAGAGHRASGGGDRGTAVHRGLCRPDARVAPGFGPNAVGAYLRPVDERLGRRAPRLRHGSGAGRVPARGEPRGIVFRPSNAAAGEDRVP